MKKSLTALLLSNTPVNMRLLLLAGVLAGCTTTHVQWDAIQMREQVIDYYNDEVMDNLIRAVNGEPFVHVDVAGVQAVAISKLAGSVGGGETSTRTNGTNPAIAATGVVATFGHTVMKPFSFTVNPERDENLTITSVPVIGAQPPLVPGEKATPNVYQLYLRFLNLNDSNPGLCNAEATFDFLGKCVSVKYVCSFPERFHLRSYVNSADTEQCYSPGTLKQRGNCWYYVPAKYRIQYLELFKAIVTAKRPGGSPLPPAPPTSTYTL